MPSDPSENTAQDALLQQVEKAFGGKAKTVQPGQPVPAEFLEVVATWAAVRQHRVWQNHPQLKAYAPTRIFGWTRSGMPLSSKHLVPKVVPDKQIF